MIFCTQCGSADWLRADPGQSSDASSLAPDQRQAVLVLPVGDERPVVVWCAACDPLVR